MDSCMRMLVVLLLVLGVTDCCVDCDRDMCPDASSCNITTVDECGCCSVCLREVGEECGGAYGKLGMCKAGLECALQRDPSEDFLGICRYTSGVSDCSAIVCPPTSFTCPWDSQYLQDSNSTAGCCAVPGTCTCDKTRCNDVMCPPRYTKRLQSAAQDSPGKCCDMFECLPDKVSSDVCVDPETGLKYASGQLWQRDPCTPCTCFAGAPQCYSNPCPRLSCMDPVKKENECCPSCPNESCGAFKCNLDCPGGYSLNEQGCPICHCSNSSNCPRSTDCLLECPNGYKASGGNCGACECHVCETMKHCTKQCEYGLHKDSRGCQLCSCNTDIRGLPARRECYENGALHEEDSTWKPNPCSDCTCYNGKTVCSMVDCPPLSDCRNLVTLPGHCCPICRDVCLDSLLIQRREGESWAENCNSCSCTNGTTRCEAITCPALQCMNAVVIPGNCCPICPTVLQNTVPDAEIRYSVAVVSKLGLQTLVRRQGTFLRHLGSLNELEFTVQLFFVTDVRALQDTSNSILSSQGTVALVKARGDRGYLSADKVVSQLRRDKVERLEPEIFRILTYSDYLSMTSRVRSTPGSRISVAAIIGAAIASILVSSLLVLYGTRRYMVLAQRRKLKQAASMCRSADQLLHTVDSSRLTINFSRHRPCEESPTPSEEGNMYSAVRGHDNLASQYNPLSSVTPTDP